MRIATLSLTRRGLLASAGAAGAAPFSTAMAQGTPYALQALLAEFAATDLAAFPEEATSLGLDRGDHADRKALLNDRSLAAVEAQRRRIRDQLAKLRGLDAAALSAPDRISFEVVEFALAAADAADQRFDFGPVGFLRAGWPYAISQITGAYANVPDFLDSQHSVETTDDAEAYLERLSAFGVALDQESDVARHDDGVGCTPPDFALAKARAAMLSFRAPAAEASTLVTSLKRKAQAAGLTTDYAPRAAHLVADRVYPALDRQIDLMRALQGRASHDAGVWKIKNGEAYYQASLTAWTTTPIAPGDLHRVGLDFVADCTHRLDVALMRQGRSGGTVAERLAALYADPELRYPNTASGRATLMADVNRDVAAVRARLPRYFGVLPKADLIVKPVPAYIEAARPAGYYESAALDGSRPGAFYINLRDTAETPRWLVPTHAYHESIPGHHLKLSIYQEAGLPLLRKTLFYNAYLEGWSMYAEQLADEMGVYEENPLGHIGRLQGALRAGAALVADTGLHVERWSRERAIAYRIDTLGEPETAAATEIERYSVWPGQACTYLLDLQFLLDLRKRAKDRLGSRFDIRRFHDAVLLSGPAPQRVLARVVDDYILDTQRKP